MAAHARRRLGSSVSLMALSASLAAVSVITPTAADCLAQSDQFLCQGLVDAAIDETPTEQRNAMNVRDVDGSIVGPFGAFFDAIPTIRFARTGSLTIKDILNGNLDAINGLDEVLFQLFDNDTEFRSSTGPVIEVINNGGDGFDGSDGDDGGGGGTSGELDFGISGLLRTSGIGVHLDASGGNGGDGGNKTGVTDGKGGNGGDGGGGGIISGTLTGTTQITTSGAERHGVVLTANGGDGGDGGNGSSLIEGRGGHGGTGGDAGSINVTIDARVTTSGVGAFGIVSAVRSISASAPTACSMMA